MCSHRFFQQKKFSLYAGLGFNSEYYYKTSVYSKTNTYEHEYIDKEIQMRSRNLAISCEGNYQLSKGISFSILPFFEKNLTNFEVDHTRYGVTLRLLVSPF
jgi:hypothetical protein